MRPHLTTPPAPVLFLFAYIFLTCSYLNLLFILCLKLFSFVYFNIFVVIFIWQNVRVYDLFFVFGGKHFGIWTGVCRR